MKNFGLDHPMFIVGPVRSGTTYLRLMLNNHPEIAFQHEIEFAVERMPESGGFPDIRQFHEYCRTYRFGSFVYDIDEKLDYPSLIKSMLEQKRTRDKKKRLGGTVHDHYERLLRIWPEASFLKTTRDGRDVALATKQLGANHVYFGIDAWISGEAAWSKLKQLVPEERRIEVRYEDLMTEPVRELKRISEWIGVEYSPAMLEYMNTDYGRGYKYPDPAWSGMWRNGLSSREVQLLESRIGDMLVERGYALSGHPRIAVSPVERRMLKLQNRFGLMKKKLDTFGPVLWAEGVISRRVGPKSWADAVQLRMNRIIDSSYEEF